MERITRINDTKIELSRCTTEELIALRGYILERVNQGNEELQVVETAIDGRFSPATLGAAAELIGESDERDAA